MSRLSKIEVEQRESYVLNMFKKDPGLSGANAQKFVVEKFGKMMRPNRIYELKRIAAEVVVNQPSDTDSAPKADVIRVPENIQVESSVVAQPEFTV